ncbi:MAG: hypothetical protein QM496_15035 [Verrucomicrobiota bacterium]
MIKKVIFSILFSGVFVLSAIADTNEEVHQLAKEKSKLSRQVRQLFRDKKVGENADYKELELAAFDASSAFVKTRREAPQLKSLYDASDAAQAKMVKAAVAKDEVAKKEAMGEYTNARRELEKAAREMPELKATQQKAVEANQAVQDKKKELLRALPEGNVLLEQIEALEKKIDKLRASL